MSTHKDSGRSWAVAVATFLIMVIETGVVKSLGVLLPDIREQFATKTWVIGFAISLVPGFGSMICLVSGVVSKALTPRTTLAVYGLMFSVGLLGLFLARNVYELIICFLFTGFSSGSTAVSFGVLSRYFNKYYKFAVTLSICGTSMGIIVMPLMAQFFLDIYGWRGSCLLLGGISFNTALVCLLFKPLKGHDDRAEYSLVPSLEELSNTRKNWHTVIIENLDLGLFTDFSYVALVMISAGNGFTLTAWLIYVVPHALDIGLSPYKASTVATVGGIGSLVGNLAYPLLCKIVSNTVLLYLSISAMSAALALDAMASLQHSYAGMVACSFMYSLARGVQVTAWTVALNDVVDNEARMVNAIGWSFGAYGFMSILGGSVSGWIFDEYGSYAPSFLLLGIVTAVTFIPQCATDIMEYRKSLAMRA